MTLDTDTVERKSAGGGGPASARHEAVGNQRQARIVVTVVMVIFSQTQQVSEEGDVPLSKYEGGRQFNELSLLDRHLHASGQASIKAGLTELLHDGRKQREVGNAEKQQHLEISGTSIARLCSL